MSYAEKSAWLMLVLGVATLLGYVIAFLIRMGDAPFAETAYVLPMIVAFAACAVLAIVGHISIAISSRNDAIRSDVRDQEIGRAGEHTGQSMLAIGGLIALALAMAEVNHFWIANTLFLAFTLSGILESATRLAAYRSGLC